MKNLKIDFLMILKVLCLLNRCVSIAIFILSYPGMVEREYCFCAKFSKLRFWWIYTFWGPLNPKITFLAIGLCVCAYVCVSICVSAYVCVCASVCAHEGNRGHLHVYTPSNWAHTDKRGRPRLEIFAKYVLFYAKYYSKLCPVENLHRSSVVRICSMLCM